MTSDIDVIVFDKDEFVGELLVAHQFRDLLQHSLARIVARVRLPGENKLHGAFRVVHHQGDFFDVGEDQIGSLVGGKAPRESDGQRIRAEHPAEALQGFRGLTPALGLFDGSEPHKFQKPRLQAEMRLPKFAIVDVFNPFPDLRLAAVLVPASTQVAVIQAKHLRRKPRGDMHAIRDVPDGNRLFRLPRKKSCPHRARYFAVKRRNSVGAPRKFQAQNGHAEFLILVMRILAPERHQPFVGKAKRIPEGSEMLFHETGIEAVVARGHGSVRCKSHLARDARHGLIEIHALFLHAAANRFQHRKPAVPFVQVKNPGRDAHGPQSAEASNAKQQLLANSNSPVSTV